MNRTFLNRKDFSCNLFLLILFLMIFGGYKVNAQHAGTGIDGYAINPKLGVCYWRSDVTCFGAGAEVSIFKNRFIYSADYYSFGEFSIMGPKPYIGFNQVSAMFGRYTGDEFFRIEYQVGAGIFWGTDRPEDEWGGEKFTSAGLTAKIGLKLVPLNFLSLGVDLQTNLNFTHSVFFPLLSIEIGKLR